jgi:hypothetical protein
MIVGALAVLAVIAAFVLGYFVGERRADQLVAERELGALQHYLSALGYVRKGDLTNAKSILYTATDGPLSFFSRDDARSLSPESQKILARWLTPLNRAWAEDKPFEGAQWSSVRAVPDWSEMRSRNDLFRERYAAKP